MTLEHNAPDMVCDKCHRRADTVHDGDDFVADERGWGSNNVVYPMNPERHGMTPEKEAAGRVAQDYEHLCPQCLAELGWSVTGDLDDPEWPFIGCYSFYAPVAPDA